MPKQTLHNRVMVQPIAHIDSRAATVRARTLRSGILQLQAIPRHTQKMELTESAVQHSL